MDRKLLYLKNWKSDDRSAFELRERERNRLKKSETDYRAKFGFSKASEIDSHPNSIILQVDEVVQWSEHFMKPDSRKDLRRNGVNGFALRLLFLEDNKYWLSTGMSIGDIERLKLHTAKVINTSNGY